MGADARLLDQVHPAKPAIGISAALVSGVLLYGGVPPGLATPLMPPIVASAAVLRWADLPPAQHPSGRYVLAHLPPAAEAVGLVGDAVMTYGLGGAGLQWWSRV